MNLRVKNVIYTLGLMSALFLVWHFRQNNKVPYVSFSGNTMGTTYHIQYFDDENRNFQLQIDSILTAFNNSLSTYSPQSEISRFNIDSTFNFISPFFLEVLIASKEIVELTNGAFDPTVMPFVNAWGFGPENNVYPDSAYIDSLKQFVGFTKVIGFDESKVWKYNRNTTLDFSAIAKGYGVDVITTYILSQGIDNLFVEIGGEVHAKGINLKTDNPWRIAIIDPNSDLAQPTFIVEMEVGDKAVATSANNFNYRVVDGVKYSHTISPFTGFPIKQEILSATVIAGNCMTADALATSFMVMGHEKAIELLNRQKTIDAFLIFSNKQGRIEQYVTQPLKNKIKQLK